MTPRLTVTLSNIIDLREKTTGQLGEWFRWPSVCYGDSWVPKHFLIPGQYQQPEFHWWLPTWVWFFSWTLLRHLQQSALFTLLCMTGQISSNLMPLRYELLLQRQQKRSKAMMLLYKLPAIRGCARHFYSNDGCGLCVTTLQPLQTNPALQQARLLALL